MGDSSGVRCGHVAALTACLLAIVLGAPRSAFPAVFPNLYTLTISPEEGVASRAEAERLALRQLLIRITGERDAGEAPELADMVASASRYVESYAVPDRQSARVSFYRTEIDRELDARGRPVWGAERPLTLLWLALDTGQGERALLPAEGVAPGASPELETLMESARAELEAVAELRGLPITFPLLDLVDMAAIDFPDVWGGFEDTIEAASARYEADAILVGRVRVTALGNDVQWLLLRGGQRQLLAGTDTGLAGTTIGDGLHFAADSYARDFSVVGGVRTVRLMIQDVTSLSDYGRVISYLEGLSALQTIDVESLDAAGLLSLRVAARGDADVLERMFTLGRVLELAEPGADALAGDNTLVLSVARTGPP